jgi:hypothetical protein
MGGDTTVGGSQECRLSDVYTQDCLFQIDDHFAPSISHPDHHQPHYQLILSRRGWPPRLPTDRT